MTRFVSLLIASAAVLAVSAADPPGVDNWTSAQLKDFEKTLAAKMSAQKVASQQLATFENHGVLVAHREGNGQGELHQRQVDVFVVQTGEAIIRVGGELVDGKQVRPNEMIGSSVRGGVEKRLQAGDVLHVPAKTPHQMLVQAGQQITYLVVKIDVP
jgi:mannose-6-phosphate isomerase-like protein (cupin superfamily)